MNLHGQRPFEGWVCGMDREAKNRAACTLPSLRDSLSEDDLLLSEDVVSWPWQSHVFSRMYLTLATTGRGNLGPRAGSSGFREDFVWRQVVQARVRLRSTRSIPSSGNEELEQHPAPVFAQSPLVHVF